MISQFVYIRNSGNADARAFGSSFTSDLLWNRQLPDAPSSTGILQGIPLVAAPLLTAIVQMARGIFSRLRPLCWAALFILFPVLITVFSFARHVAGEEVPNPVGEPFMKR